VKIVPRETIERFAREEYRKRYAESTAPAPANFGPVLELNSADVILLFRGRAYRSPPVSYPDAVRLCELSYALVDLAKGVESEQAVRQMRAIGRVQAEAVRMFRRLCRPTDWRRFLWPLIPNPFRRASPKEVDNLLGFFWQRQMASGVRSPPRPDPRKN
jgi:hypothetical protein